MPPYPRQVARTREGIMAHRLVAFDVQRGRIYIGDGEELAKLMSVNGGNRAALPSRPAQGGDVSTSTAHPNGTRTSVRDFARRFANRRLYERIAILSYYAHRIEGRSALTSRDLSDWFGLCGFKVRVRIAKSFVKLI